MRVCNVCIALCCSILFMHLCLHLLLLSMCMEFCPYICVCVCVCVLCVVWVLLSYCLGLLTQRLMQLCSLVVDLPLALYVCVFSSFLSFPDTAASETEQVTAFFEVAINSDLFFQKLH